MAGVERQTKKTSEAEWSISTTQMIVAVCWCHVSGVQWFIQWTAQAWLNIKTNEKNSNVKCDLNYLRAKFWLLNVLFSKRIHLKLFYLIKLYY